MRVLFFVFFLCLACYAHGWVARGITPQEKREGHPNECWHEGIGYLNNGVTKRLPDQCAEINCQANGEYGITGCISVNVEPPCTVEAGILSKPFPDCCFEIKCPKNNKQ